MRLKLIAAALALSTALTPVQAHAGIVSGIVALVSGALNAVGVSVVAQAVIGSALLSVGGALGSVLIGIALNFAVNALFAPDAGSLPAPQPQEIQGNFLQAEAARFMLGGRLRVGGQVILAEVKDGLLYKLVAQGDAEATTEISTYLSDIAVTLDGDGNVTDDEFKYNGGTYFAIEKRAGTPSQAASSTLTAAFTEWTANHKGAGVSDTLLTLRAPSNEAYNRIRRHRGVLGLGEPDVTRAAWYGRYYDPRNDSNNGGSGTERVDDPTTWGPNLGNCALFWATHRMDAERFNNDSGDINWTNVAAQADICDEQVQDRYANFANRYEVALAINKDRHTNKQAEDWILGACDGVLWTDDDGKLGLYVGKYDSDPDLVLTDADIGDIESMDGNDGESLATHYIASYTEPNFAFKGTQSATWVAPDYVVSDKIKTQKVEIYQVPNHNQTIRLLKAAIGRQHETKRLAVQAGIRGIFAKRRRFIRLNLASDAALSGIYEVVPGADTFDGLTIPLVLIRCDDDRWNLTAGEEGERPNFNTTITVDNSLTNIIQANMSVQPAQIANTSGTSSVRLLATFTKPTREDVIVQIQYRLKTTSIWEEFSVRTEDGAGTSAIVSDGATYEYRWRVYTISGSASDWSAIYEVVATADATAPGALSATSVDDTVAGQATYKWTAPSSLNYYATRVYRADGASADFDDANEIRIEPGLPSDPDTHTETGLSAGDYRAWLEPLNGSLVAGTRVGPIDFTIT
ncbi:hypothetical protein [Hoeflea sp. TYP-13]|uniref:hypothetical protein n=1 Tax=Hoeflea sp. TYP-13 TaxID=3230023 RepID=UPI0034C69FDA